uniref:Uncharacterized protein n=2 Tax=Chromera velia CCMP2878 TaxID=1169474 RepID=A0A0G4GE89_9ALVE|eukprot:Cvel_21394.t1-p1 / transcript=Cvel_21394.t1 / gene=Cvel_21394 / organism=Chromera_velia_CCMP2878 / gene_product=hypothetical protein / transcript_product=hypothetical protein / location=Cvel_scaffold2003:6329-8800(-) / protein_length=394 / sequence_SO=supercontig / SO=protein_coding / is_pseudo=false
MPFRLIHEISDRLPFLPPFSEYLQAPRGVSASSLTPLRSTTTLRGASPAGISALKKKSEEEGEDTTGWYTDEEPFYPCYEASMKILELFFHIYDIVAVTWDPEELKELEEHEGFKKSYMKAQWAIADKIAGVMDAELAWGCMDYFKELSIDKKCTEIFSSPIQLPEEEYVDKKRDEKMKARCKQLGNKSEMNSHVTSALVKDLDFSFFLSCLLQVKDLDFNQLPLQSPKLAVDLINPEISMNADTGPTWDSLLEMAEKGEPPSCPRDPVRSKLMEKNEKKGVGLVRTLSDEWKQFDYVYGGEYADFAQVEEQVIHSPAALLQKGVGPGMFDGFFKGLNVAKYAALGLIVGGVMLFICGGVVVKVVAYVVATIGVTIGIAALVALIKVASAMTKR